MPIPMSAYKLMSLAGIAARAVNDRRFIESRGMCAAFQRQVVQAKYGTLFDKYFYKGTAHGQMQAFRNSPFVVTAEIKSGDLLFWAATHNQPEGHAAIAGSNHGIIENSSIHYGSDRNGKGFRSLSDMRKPDLIVRLNPRAR